ncbi:MAG: hypothetical protein J6D18_00610 [Erysipelotrichaceae bacterium]|nr:hypothetical protein [Erysipelotrichaceae bacterium]
MEPVYSYAYWIIYSFFGWLVESNYVSFHEKHWVNRGFLYGPVIPIYGFGAMIVLYLIKPWVAHPALVFLLTCVLTAGLEYVTSWAMETMFHTRWWDYSTYPFNINGRVCLKNTVLFGILGLVVLYGIHPVVVNAVRAVPMSTLLVAQMAYTIYFSVDFTFTLIALIRRKQIIEKAEAEMNRLTLAFETDMTQKIGEMETKIEEWESKRIEVSAQQRNQLKELIRNRKEKKEYLFQWIASEKERRAGVSQWRQSLQSLADSHLSKAFSRQIKPRALEEIQQVLLKIQNSQRS